ncbi:MAG: hypothetical protein JO240_09510 [Solirubrobacterales bacterium]|nr:hypothetical protein [Solirubrobacterales bacterium]
MTFASIHDIAASWDLYERFLANLAAPPPEGLALHLAGPTDEGVRIVAIWHTKHAFERFQREALAPAIATLGGTIAPQWTLRGLHLAHVVLGKSAPAPTDKEQHQCRDAQSSPPPAPPCWPSRA